MSNVEIFRNYINNQNIHMDELQEDDGSIFFRTRQSFENGGSVAVVVAFDLDEDLIDLSIFNIASIKNPLKKEAVHNYINELNVNYRFTKFMEYDGNISAQYSYNVETNRLDPASLMDMLIMLLRAAEESYPKFMKLQWG